MKALLLLISQRRILRLWTGGLLLALAPFIGFAQTMDLGLPRSWQETDLQELVYLTLPAFDAEATAAEDAINDQHKDRPWRFGIEHEVDINLLELSNVHELPGVGTIYRFGISSPDAISINMIFSDFWLPPGATLHLYGKNPEDIVGAYTARNNHPSGQLGTDLVPGDRITVEYFEPLGAESAHLQVQTIIHGYRSPGLIKDEMLKALNDSGDCNHDVGCPAGSGWGDQIRSVGLLFTGGGTCSGALINNTANDGTPYFLTARHCGSSYGSWVVRFNWESTIPVCASTDNSVDPGAPYDQTMNGATLNATNSGSDFTLVTLDNLSLELMQQWNLFLAGWDRSGNAPTSSTGIHHPSGDVKKICHDNNAATTNTINFNGDANAMMWRIADWDVGVTEPGSSGSPLFDQNQRIIGQLCCGAADCSGTDDNDQHDHYGRFDVSWDGANAASRLRDWLDPNNSAPNTLNGLDANDLVPYNDLCGDAVDLSCGDSASGNTDNATASGSIPICEGGGVPNAGVWFSFVGTGDIVTVSTAGSTFDTQLNIYDGSCGSLSCIAGDDDAGPGTTSEITFCSEVGTTYYIYVDGFGGTTGDYEIAISCSADNTPPSINCAASFTVPNDPGECEADVTLPVPAASDFCGVETLEFRYREVNAGNVPIGPWSAWMDYTANNITLAVGRYRIRWRATDTSGNSAGCTRYVTVEDVEPPIINCNNFEITFNGEEFIDLLVGDLAVASDNCAIADLSLDIDRIYCEDLGEQIPVTVTATDDSGLSSMCVSVVDVLGLPCGWSQQPDGVGCVDGNDVSYDVPTEVFSVSSTDCHNAITTDTDEYAFAQYNLCDDGMITAQVTSITGSANGWAGVTMRESNDPQAPAVSLMTNLAQNHRTELRLTAGGDVTSALSPSFNRHWLRIQRFGNNFRGFVSFNGLSWFQKFNIYVPMGQCIEVGLIVNSSASSGDNTGTFANVSVVGDTFFEFSALPPMNLLRVTERMLSIAPNPTTGQAVIQLGDFTGLEGELDLIDLTGQLVQPIRRGLLEHSTEEIDLSEQPAGLYFVRLRLADGTVEVARIVLQPRP